MDADHQKTRTLWLVGILHAFTHIYHVALFPLYLLIQKDLRLESVGAAPLLVTVMGLAYITPSYAMGVLADRCNRRVLLGVGLIINGLGFVGFSYAQTYTQALGWVVLAGLGGSSYHPAATALIARLYPVGTGRALGLSAIGASVGFLAGPLYCGWRAMQAGTWRAPVFDLGVAGILGALAFLWVADDEVRQPAVAGTPDKHQRIFPTPTLWLLFLTAAVGFSLRDFGGAGLGSLSSLFLQQAQGFNPRETGLALSGIFVASLISNPLFGNLSDSGRGRWVCFVLVIAATFIAVFPHLPRAGFNVGLIAYGFFFLASYPIVEAAVMESVPDAVRGRVFGLFITIGGLVGNSAHWAVGQLVRKLGPRASQAESYYPLFGTLALLVVLSVAALPFLKALRRREHLEVSHKLEAAR